MKNGKRAEKRCSRTENKANKNKPTRVIDQLNCLIKGWDCEIYNHMVEGIEKRLERKKKMCNMTIYVGKQTDDRTTSNQSSVDSIYVYCCLKMTNPL